ncbi:MAG TPA: hypothetical protein PLE74_10205 [Candidatus Cloacimonadota bacterium]|nr:hypothetical protein [Candidatus Cloacimonadota bacterium]HPT72639.1 hypothetical protein [Candidatus Cloacimonadota bacterium]
MNIVRIAYINVRMSYQLHEAFQSLSNGIPIPYQSLSNLSGLEWDRKWIGKAWDIDCNVLETTWLIPCIRYGVQTSYESNDLTRFEDVRTSYPAGG